MFYKFSSATSNFQIVHARPGRVPAGAGPARPGPEMLKVSEIFSFLPPDWRLDWRGQGEMRVCLKLCFIPHNLSPAETTHWVVSELWWAEIARAAN